MQTAHRQIDRQAAGLVVSIHDVSPLTAEPVRDMLADLADWGVARTSLLVIPDHHHRGRFVEDEMFCEWLRALVAAGHEVVAHGYYHQRERRGGEGIAARLVTERYTAGEGEFFDLPEDEATIRLERAKSEFAVAGLSPTGFIAPAWLLGDEAMRAVRRAGFRYTTRIGQIEDFAGEGRIYRSQSLVYSVRAAWRRVVSLGWNSLLLRALRHRPLVRIGLHPPDWRFPAIRRHAQNCLVRALAGREALTYDGWLERQTALPANR